VPIVPSVQVSVLVSRSVPLLVSVMSVPFALVFMFGLAGVHPVLSCSFMIVFSVVGAQPLLYIVSLLSNTLSGLMVCGVSLMVCSIAFALCCCIVRFVCLFLVMLLG